MLLVIHSKFVDLVWGEGGFCGCLFKCKRELFIFFLYAESTRHLSSLTYLQSHRWLTQGSPIVVSCVNAARRCCCCNHTYILLAGHADIVVRIIGQWMFILVHWSLFGIICLRHIGLSQSMLPLINQSCVYNFVTQSILLVPGMGVEITRRRFTVPLPLFLFSYPLLILLAGSWRERLH